MTKYYNVGSIATAILTLLAVHFCVPAIAQFTAIGSGSYTTTHPGTDQAGRNGFPSGTPQLSGSVVGKPVPTNDWWSTLIKEDHANNLFNYPMAMRTTNGGLAVNYLAWGPLGDAQQVFVGVSGLDASKAVVSDYSDWTVQIDWNDGTHRMKATSGIGMPFLYFTKENSDVAEITVNSGTATISNEMLVVENTSSGADFAVYAPTGSQWVENGNTYTSTLNGKNYWSMAMLPQSTTDANAVANAYKKYAYVFPANTTTTWTYNEATSVLRTDFVVETDVKEGSETNMLLGLLPHQWANLASNSAQPAETSYNSVRGELKMLNGNTFSVENTFYGILPTLPNLSSYSEGFSLAELDQKIKSLENDGLATWTDSYNEGQVMNRLIQTARIADLAGNTVSRDKIIATIKERLEDWLIAESGEVAFLFYYNNDWKALLGYPAGHGQDNNINDHHFHWGYFIHAAAFLEQFEPGWADQWGDMINHLVRDASSPNRNDEKFPFLRNFSPYAGHCWANGFASFPQGNDQESTSESMQFHSSLIHWGTITGNDEIRDLGIYLYTTEQTAVEEYWFDMHERNFKPDQQYSLVSRVWGNSYDNGTFWTAELAASYNIELYPIHGGSLYLGHNTAYAEKLWNEMVANTNVLTNTPNPNVWHDTMWKFLAFTNPERAIELYNAYPERNLKFGVSDAQTYYWLHAMNALGKVDVSITADYPIATAFKKGTDITYTAHNYSNEAITVHFSDGFNLEVPANSMATNKDVDIESTLSTPFPQAVVGGSIKLLLDVQAGNVTKVEFYQGTSKIGESTASPYNVTTSGLSAGKHGFYAKVYDGDAFAVTNIVDVTVGSQVPFGDVPNAIPGTLEAGKYDKFEGGLGQGVTYSDVSPNNEGDFRPEEYVDAVNSGSEGVTVGWTSNGEWLEYTVDVQTSGIYDMTYRYASANGNGGGPFHVELDGQAVTESISAGSTGGWNTWQSQTVNGLELPQGKHVLKVVFSGGEFNLGKMTFARTADLPYSQPVAIAGDDVTVVLPETSVTLNASNSSDPDGQALTYAWEQISGPSVVTFSSTTSASPLVSSLEEGIYQIKVTVSNGSYSAQDELYVIVSETGTVPPSVALTSPSDNESFIAGKNVTISATASDFNGTVTQVEFFANDVSIGTDNTVPYSVNWTGTIDEYVIKAVATDNDGETGTSQTRTITLTAPPSCDGVAENGHYSYIFSDDASNPTITFIPVLNGVGDNVCILNYNTGNGNIGVNVTPNVPHQLTLEEGTEISFYFTYSHPEGGERNTSENPHNYVIGTCAYGEAGAPPTVSITSPSDGLMTEGENITISVDASDADGTIAKVELFANDVSIGVLTTAPFNMNWTLPSGTQELKAIATDDDDNTTTSLSVTITTKPAATCYSGTASNGHFSYIFSEDSQNPTLTFVPLEDGMGNPTCILYYKVNGADMGGHLATPNQPFQLNAAQGSTVSFYYTYTHPAGGERNTSQDPISFEVGQECGEEENQAPEISITSPVNNTLVTTGNTVTITANASDSDGSIKEVEFFVNNASIGVDNTAPYSIEWVVVAGESTIKAVAKDNEDLTTTSDEVEVSTELTAPSCYSGDAPSGDFSYVFSDDSENPTLTFIPSQNGMGDATCILFYGTTEGGNYPGYNVTPNVPFQLTATEGSTVYFYYTYSHPEGGERNNMDSPISFEVGQECEDEGNEAPTVSITAPVNNSTETVNESITISADASDADGTITQVEFFVDGVSIGVDDTAPYSVTWTPSQAKTYSLTAVAKDNEESTTTSDAISVEIEDNVTSIGNIEKQQIVFYPNPVVNAINIQLQESVNNILIYNINGKLISKKQVSSGTQQIDMSTFASGIYFFEVHHKNGIDNFKVFKK